MYKVRIDENSGEIFRESDNELVAKLNNFYYSDFRRYPNMLKPINLKSLNGDQLTLKYGGFVNGHFKETCHLKCLWGRNCLKYKKSGCIYSSDFENVGFYIF